MQWKERVKRALQHTRGFTDRVLGEFAMAEDWIRRPAEGGNHALWIAGHLGYATNGFIGWVDPSRKVERDDYVTLFGKGSVPQDELSAYPPPGDVQAFLSERGTVLLELLDQCTDADLARPVSQGPAFMDDVGAVFQMAIWHESLHSGQLAVIHRMLGHLPISDR